MTLWIAFMVLLVLSVGFHYLDKHRERPEMKELRRLYVGTPGYVALSCDFLAVGCLVLIVLRRFGVDIPALWDR
jgi:hypothetical protein